MICCRIAHWHVSDLYDRLLGWNLMKVLITNSKTRVLRVGYANFFLPVGFLFCSVVFTWLSDHNYSTMFSSLVGVAIGVVFLWLYSKTVSRIEFTEQAIDFECAVNSYHFQIQEIRKIKLSTVPASKYAILTIKRKKPLRSAFFHFVAPETNLGNFSDSMKKLADKIEELNRKLGK